MKVEVKGGAMSGDEIKIYADYIKTKHRTRTFPDCKSKLTVSMSI